MAVPIAATAAPECKYKGERNLSIDPGSISQLTVAIEEGAIAVQVESDLTSIEVKGTACTSNEEKLPEFQLQNTGGQLTTDVPKAGGFFGGGYAYFDLSIRMPPGIALVAESKSASLSAYGVQAVKLTGNWSDVQVQSVPGPVDIERNENAVTIDDIGSLHLGTNGPGDIKVTNVKGDVKIDADGSGNIDVNGVGGSVLIGNDIAGNIFVRKVIGDFSLQRHGAGQMNYADINGKVSLP